MEAKVDLQVAGQLVGLAPVHSVEKRKKASTSVQVLKAVEPLAEVGQVVVYALVASAATESSQDLAKL